LFITQAEASKNGLFFNIAASGTPANLSVSVCLNGAGALSCQQYNVSALSLSVTTTILNHTYPAAGIKILTPNYVLSGCTPAPNGYCLFSVSNTSSAGISIQPSLVLNYWVATNGNDSANGDVNHPFLTIGHAQDVIRANPARGTDTIYVNIKGGIYRLNNTLTFNQSDSGTINGRVIYRAAPGETPEISGAEKITGWTLPPGSSIWQAQATVNTFTMPRQLYVNGVRATRARSQPPSTPPYNTPPFYYTNYYKPNLAGTGYTYGYTSGSDPQIPPTWNNPTAVEVVTATQWKMSRCPVASVSGNDVTMQTPCWTNANTYPVPWNFQYISWFENALEFLTVPGYWYLDPVTKIVYYMPKPGEDMTTADVELPILQTLVQGKGDQSSPVSYISFQGLTFEYATWVDIDSTTNSSPSSSNGYVTDQSGFHLLGTDHHSTLNITGHDPNVTRTPGNVSFIYAQNIIFTNNTFQHLGAAGLDFGTGSQNTQIVNNTFNDISSTAIQMGGVLPVDHHPSLLSQFTQDNLISNNLVENVGQEFFDAAGIFVGVTTRTTVSHNTINNVPWSGIAIGWGWGLIDPGGYPGIPNATQYMWGVYNTPSAAHGNQITNNLITNFLQQLWDGGAIYSTGFQGTSMSDGQFITMNVAENKRTEAGGNIFYTDGGSRFDTVSQNVSLNSPPGSANYGSCLVSDAFGSPAYYCLLTGIPYGADMGGCTPYGDLTFTNNYFRDQVTFYNPCVLVNPTHPVNLSLINNIQVSSASQVPASILNAAGQQ